MEYLRCRVASPVPDLGIELHGLHAKRISYGYFYCGWSMVAFNSDKCMS